MSSYTTSQFISGLAPLRQAMALAVRELEEISHVRGTAEQVLSDTLMARSALIQVETQLRGMKLVPSGLPEGLHADLLRLAALQEEACEFLDTLQLLRQMGQPQAEVSVELLQYVRGAVRDLCPMLTVCAVSVMEAEELAEAGELAAELLSAKVSEACDAEVSTEASDVSEGSLGLPSDLDFLYLQLQAHREEVRRLEDEVLVRAPVSAWFAATERLADHLIALADDVQLSEEAEHSKADLLADVHVTQDQLQYLLELQRPQLTQRLCTVTRSLRVLGERGSEALRLVREHEVGAGEVALGLLGAMGELIELVQALEEAVEVGSSEELSVAREGMLVAFAEAHRIFMDLEEAVDAEVQLLLDLEQEVLLSCDAVQGAALEKGEADLVAMLALECSEVAEDLRWTFGGLGGFEGPLDELLVLAGRALDQTQATSTQAHEIDQLLAEALLLEQCEADAMAMGVLELGEEAECLRSSHEPADLGALDARLAALMVRASQRLAEEHEEREFLLSADLALELQQIFNKVVDLIAAQQTLSSHPAGSEDLLAMQALELSEQVECLRSGDNAESEVVECLLGSIGELLVLVGLLLEAPRATKLVVEPTASVEVLGAQMMQALQEVSCLLGRSLASGEDATLVREADQLAMQALDLSETLERVPCDVAQDLESCSIDLLELSAQVLDAASKKGSLDAAHKVLEPEILELADQVCANVEVIEELLLTVGLLPSSQGVPLAHELADQLQDQIQLSDKLFDLLEGIAACPVMSLLADLLESVAETLEAVMLVLEEDAKQSEEAQAAVDEYAVNLVLEVLSVIDEASEGLAQIQSQVDEALDLRGDTNDLADLTSELRLQLHANSDVVDELVDLLVRMHEDPMTCDLPLELCDEALLRSLEDTLAISASLDQLCAAVQVQMDADKVCAELVRDTDRVRQQIRKLQFQVSRSTSMARFERAAAALAERVFELDEVAYAVQQCCSPGFAELCDDTMHSCLSELARLGRQLVQAEPAPQMALTATSSASQVLATLLSAAQRATQCIEEHAHHEEKLHAAAQLLELDTLLDRVAETAPHTTGLVQARALMDSALVRCLACC